MTGAALAGALALTALVVLTACCTLALWVHGLKRVDYRAWHRPTASAIGILAGALFIAAIWVGFANLTPSPM